MTKDEVGIVLNEANIEEIYRRLKGTSRERTMQQLRDRMVADQRTAIALKKPGYHSVVMVPKEKATDT